LQIVIRNLMADRRGHPKMAKSGRPELRLLGENPG
jgi:hypothetical protein